MPHPFLLAILKGGKKVMDIREELNELFNNDTEFVNKFLDGVNAGNDEALSRIARALTDENSTQAVVEEIVDEVEVVEEVVTEEVEEVVAEVEATEVVEVVTEEVEVEVTEDVVEDEVIEVELGETFIADLVGSDEFRSIVGELINTAVSEVEARYEEQIRQANKATEDAQEWVSDVPARTRRAVASFRPRSNKQQVAVASNGVATSTAVQTEILTMTETAKNSVDDIFGGE